MKPLLGAVAALALAAGAALAGPTNVGAWTTGTPLTTPRSAPAGGPVNGGSRQSDTRLAFRRP